MSDGQTLVDLFGIVGKVPPHALADRLQGFKSVARSGRMNPRAFEGAMIDTDKAIGLAFFQRTRRGCISAPHEVGLLCDNGAIMGFRSVRLAGPLGNL